MIKIRNKYLQAILNSYSMVFFSQHQFLALMLLLTTFFHPLAGISGLLSVVFTVILLTLNGHQQEIIKSGIYSFNSLILGVGFGTFYQLNIAFCIWLMIAVLVNAMLTVIIYARTSKYGFPVLSLPFIISFWLILLAANGFAGIGLTRSDYLLNDFFTGNYQVKISLPFYADLFFRSLSAVLFQNNVIAGMLIGIGIFVHSRIAFSLLLTGFTAAIIFNAVTGIYPEGISYYNLGGNLMPVAFAAGSFFLIPSARSYGWAIVSVIVSLLFITAFTSAFNRLHLPLFSLPFCVVSLLFLGFFRLRLKAGKLVLTPLQHYSPETNLYLYLSHQKRLKNLPFLRLNLPFLGSWKVSQGYDGSITHKGEWSKALDFVIEDEDTKTYRFPGTSPEHFYCYNKPVLACADGTVEEVVNDVDDNLIGQVNLTENWGNTIIIKHSDGLYSKVSHLKKDSVKVAAGDKVKEGNVIGLCGNSGCSPEPHLHFQVQATPFIGSKTLAYPFAYYVGYPSTQNQNLQTFKTPAENTVVKAVETNFELKKAFALKPGNTVKVSTTNGETEVWEVCVDAFYQHYIYCKKSDSYAYFVNDGASFYFSSFYGDQNTLLYYFFLLAFKVIFSAESFIEVKDQFPLSIRQHKKTFWLQDLAAPFYRFVNYHYQSNCVLVSSGAEIKSSGTEQIFNHQEQFFYGEIRISNQKISGFTINIKSKIIEAEWVIENIY